MNRSLCALYSIIDDGFSYADTTVSSFLHINKSYFCISSYQTPEKPSWNFDWNSLTLQVIWGKLIPSQYWLSVHEHNKSVYLDRFFVCVGVLDFFARFNPRHKYDIFWLYYKCHITFLGICWWHIEMQLTFVY